ncbi:MAG: carboxynorspermidine decarboxylase [Bacteroidota bacterium]
MPPPAFVLEIEKLKTNLSLIQSVARAAEVDIILALKAYSFWPTFPLIKQYLAGATASSLHEALLIKRHMGLKPHVYSPAYLPHQMEEIAKLAGHLTMNSLGELERHRSIWEKADCSVGLRINPEYSPVTTDLYNPASPYGRLGETLPNLPSLPPDGLEGLHAHVLCESSAAHTQELIQRLIQQFGHYLSRLQWLNLGGGHLMTKEGYDLDLLINALRSLQKKFPHLHIILEPGSAIAWQAGYLRSTVLDVIENYGRRTAILDISFTCHLPDTLEMPYRPNVRTASSTEIEPAYAYQLGGVSCLAGDYLSEYWFPQPLLPGDEVIFEDMLHYTTVKTTTFNGVHHPDLCLQYADGSVETVRQFGYEDFVRKLG